MCEGEDEEAVVELTNVHNLYRILQDKWATEFLFHSLSIFFSKNESHRVSYTHTYALCNALTHAHCLTINRA